MAIPSFSQFDWLHQQPTWGAEPDYKTAIRTARFERWQPVWKMVMLAGFSDYQVGRLLRLREEYEGGFSRRG